MSQTISRAIPHGLFATWSSNFPGTLSAITVGVAAMFLSDHYGGPTMLYALLLGMAFHFLSQEGRCTEGIRFASTTLLRIGVALLGLRITTGQIAALGLVPLLIALLSLTATILFGWQLARRLKLRSDFGVLTGCAVAICGASAALAVSSVLPKHEHSERDTLFAVLGVTCLSTLAMIFYPMVIAALGLGEHAAGIVLGGTIHDVAQVVAAGYGISSAAGDTATIVKLMRVGMLLPICLIVAAAYRRPQHSATHVDNKRPPLLPPFLLAFAILVLINSLVQLPTQLVSSMGELSRWCLVTAISAIGMKTSLQALAKLGARPILLIVSETLFLAILVTAAVAFIH